MMFTIHQKRFSFLKKTFISFFTDGANRPGVNRPVRKMGLERIVPGGTGFGANRPVTLISCAETAQLICGFVIEYAKCRFSHDLAQLKLATDYANKDSDQLRSNFAAD